MRLIPLLFLLVFNIFYLNAQTYEYLGILKLPDSSIVTYRLDFTENAGKIKGYSYTDLNGLHETKSSIVGRFDDRENTLEFREVDIVYTKSPITEMDFCYLYFTGKLRKLNERAKISGEFKSYYNDLQACINGEIEMNNAEKIDNRLQKTQNKIKRSNRVADSIKERIDLDKMYNRFTKNALRGGETVNILWKDEYLKLVLWDDGEEDGDQIDLIINGNKILNAYMPVNKKKEMELTLTDPINTISIKAINLGTKPPNTAKIQLVKKNGEVIDLASDLKLGETVNFVFYKEQPVINK